MDSVYLHRVLSSDKGTFGVLIYKNKPVCVTCEDPWNDNKVGISCIPFGEYKVSPHSSEKYPNVWIVNGVKGRSAILIHAGNTIKDTQGCVLVGEYFTDFNGVPGIANSGLTLNRLRKLLPKEFKLVILD